MPNSIYDQLGQGLRQAARYGKRQILYRGKVLTVSVLLGNTSTALADGGLQVDSVAHVLIPRALVPIGQDGQPQTNERITYPAVETDGVQPREYMIHKIVSQEWDYALELLDLTA